MKIPFLDLKAQYLSIKEEIDTSIQDILDNTSFVGGEIVQQFEKDFAVYIGINHCIACANGTDALEIMLKAMGVGQGDEVIVPAISWISTSGAVSAVGATPIFVDIEPEYYCIDATLIEERITKKTKAIIPVHLYGQPADMIAIMKIAKKYDLKVLEDCAQAHGASIQDQKVGTWGDAATFSFYPGKNLGAYGDAGAMICNDQTLAEKARRLANHGMITKHDHKLEGRNSRMDTIQAKILSIKLKYLDQWNDQRIKNAKLYNTLIENESITKPLQRINTKHVFHLYVIQSKDREKLQKKLNNEGIATSIHYPKALPFLECYKNLNFSSIDYPVAYKIQNYILSLPMYPELSKIYISKISNKI